MSLSKSAPKDPKKSGPKDPLESLKQKYLSAPTEKLKKFYSDMIIRKGGKLPRL